QLNLPGRGQATGMHGAEGGRYRSVHHKRQGGASVNAIDLLEDDHRKVKKMLAEGEETTERAEVTRTDLYATLRREMETHERIEEEIFYPALKQHPKAKDIVLEGFEEHHVVDEIMGELGETDVTDETWAAKFE